MPSFFNEPLLCGVCEASKKRPAFRIYKRRFIFNDNFLRVINDSSRFIIGGAGDRHEKIDIRRFATPLIIGAGLISAITGLLMFFITEDPFLFAHEIVGLGFSVAILLHIYTNWRPFKKYFSQRGVIIIAVAWLIGIGLIARTAIFSEGEPEELIMERIEQTSLTRIAPIVDMQVETLIKRLGADGYTVSDPEMSIEALAEAHGADTDAVLLSVFRE